MTIYTQDIVGTGYLEELSLPIGESTAATFGTQRTVGRLGLSSIGLLDEEYAEPSPLVDAETARKRIKELNFDITVPDEGIKQNKLDALIEINQDRRTRESIIQRGPEGFLAGTANIGAAFLASFTDPVEVGLSFIPVVGQARYTALLANAGSKLARAGVRARVGAVEGLAGAAIAEPFIYAASRYEQTDYDMTDVLESLAFGTVFGGGLHMGAGALADSFRRNGTTALASPEGAAATTINSLSPQTRVDALSAAINQAVSGRQIDVETILEMDLRFRDMRARAMETTSLTPVARTTFGLQEPPVPPGMTRLYHGSSTPGRLDGKAWFSTSRQYAESYRPGAELQYVDYPTSKVNAALDPDGYGQTVERGFTWNVELDVAETGPRKVLGISGGQQSKTELGQPNAVESAIGTNVSESLVEPPLRATTGAMDSKGEIPIYQTAREAERIRDKVLKNRGEELEIQQLPDGTYTLLRAYDAQPVRNADGTPMAFDTERAAAKAAKSITDLKDRDLTPVAFMDGGQMKFALVENAPKGMADAAKRNPDLVDLGIAMDRTVNAASKLVDEEQARARVQEAYNRMRESYRPENARLADMQAVRKFDEIYKSISDEDTIERVIETSDNIIDESIRLADALNIRKELDVELSRLDAEIKDAEAIGRGFEAAGLCSLRRS